MGYIIDILDNPIEGDTIIELYREGVVQTVLPLDGRWDRMVKSPAALGEWTRALAERGLVFETFKVYEYVGGEWREMVLVDDEGGVTWLMQT